MICDHAGGGVLDWALGKDETDRFVLKLAYKCGSCGTPFVFDDRLVIIAANIEHPCPVLHESPDHKELIVAVKPLETVH